MIANHKKREASQPLDMPNAGSVFKRPRNGYASRLIDEAGLKGLTIGGAMVSNKHAGFIVNTGNATSNDINDLVNIIQKIIYTILKNKKIIYQTSFGKVLLKKLSKNYLHFAEILSQNNISITNH
jgi:UDP-N-acetylenolpyruvoylglucosamine reductase